MSKRDCCNNYKVRFNTNLYHLICLDYNAQPGRTAKGLLLMQNRIYENAYIHKATEYTACFQHTVTCIHIARQQISKHYRGSQRAQQ
jgi:hypothetical protein